MVRLARARSYNDMPVSTCRSLSLDHNCKTDQDKAMFLRKNVLDVGPGVSAPATYLVPAFISFSLITDSPHHGAGGKTMSAARFGLGCRVRTRSAWSARGVQLSPFAGCEHFDVIGVDRGPVFQTMGAYGSIDQGPWKEDHEMGVVGNGAGVDVVRVSARPCGLASEARPRSECRAACRSWKTCTEDTTWEEPAENSHFNAVATQTHRTSPTKMSSPRDGSVPI